MVLGRSHAIVETGVKVTASLYPPTRENIRPDRSCQLVLQKRVHCIRFVIEKLIAVLCLFKRWEAEHRAAKFMLFYLKCKSFEVHNGQKYGCYFGLGGSKVDH